MAKLWRTVRARPWMTVLIVVVIVGAAGGGVYWFTHRSTAATAAGATTTSVVTVSTGTITKSISATGTITPAVQDDVDFAASGKVTSVRVIQGQRVAQGQVLGTIDTVDLKAAVASAKAGLASVNAKVANDTTAVTTAATTTSTADDAAAAAQLTADKASVVTAQAQVTAAEKALANATLRSPIAGVVATVSVAVGDQVSGTTSSSSNSTGTGTGSASGNGGGSGAGSGSGSGSGTGSNTGSGTGSSSSNSSTAQFLVVGTTAWQAAVTVDDSEINLIKKGIQAQLTVSSSTNLLFGKVTAIGLISSGTSNGAASYPVTVTITGSPAGLHDGTSATVELIYEQLAGVLTVPTFALHTENGHRVVYQMKDGKQISTVVTVGQSSGATTQITGGLAEGDQILVTTATRPAGSGGSGRTTSGTGRFGGGFGGGGFNPGGGAGGFTGGGAGGFTGGQGGAPAGAPAGAPGGN